jgi:hypothetical protein
VIEHYQFSRLIQSDPHGLALLNLQAPTGRKNRGSRQRQSLKQLQAACQRNWRFQESHPILLLPKFVSIAVAAIFPGLDGEATRPPLKCGKLLHCARKKEKQLLRITRKYPRITKLRSDQAIFVLNLGKHALCALRHHATAAQCHLLSRNMAKYGLRTERVEARSPKPSATRSPPPSGRPRCLFPVARVRVMVEKLPPFGSRSRSLTFHPAFSSALREAGMGPVPMIAGSTPAVAHAAIRASGVSPRAAASLALIKTTTAAPSLIPDAFPAVTVYW